MADLIRATRISVRLQGVRALDIMIDQLRDIFLLVAVGFVFVAWVIETRRKKAIPTGTCLVLVAGLVFLLGGRVLEMMDPGALGMSSLLKGVLQEIVGYCLGFVFLVTGIIMWLPTLTGREMTQPKHLTRGAIVGDTKDILESGITAAYSAQDLLYSMLRSSLSGIMFLNAIRDRAEDVVDFEIRLVNDEAQQLLGRSKDTLIGRLLFEQFPCIRKANLLGDMTSVIETGLPSRSERVFKLGHSARWYQYAAVKLADGIAVTFADINSQKQAEQQLKHAAHHDTLTGLPNRALFTERLKQALARSKRFPDYKFAVLFLDFDRFKHTNDTLGHEAGDQLLIGISTRLRLNLRSVDLPSRAGEDGHLPARLGGDEFVILLDSIGDIRDAVRVAERLQRELSQPHDLDGHEVISTASIGVVSSELGYNTVDDIIRDADTAMYRAKMSGKARHVVFDDKMHAEVVARVEREDELRTAVEQGQFELEYEPVVDLESGEVKGVEALVRWHHPTAGIVQPNEFISLAEELNLGAALGNWILKKAGAALQEWHRNDPEFGPFTMSVNLSRQCLLHPDLVPTLEEILKSLDIPPASLQLELTEGMIMDDIKNTSPLLQHLKSLGLTLVMDDFGTGHSSLTCLHDFPIDIIKIDRDFTKHVPDHRKYGAVINSVVSLAHNLNMKVVAEGVETEEHLALLQALECDYGQGHHLCKPLHAREVPKLRDGLPKDRGAAEGDPCAEAA